MKRIRQKTTGMYFAQGEWTGEFKKAQVFSTPGEAQRACREFQLANVELVYCFGEEPTKWDFAVPLGG